MTLSLSPACGDYFPPPCDLPAPVTRPHPLGSPAPSTAFKPRLPSLDFSNSQAAHVGQYWSGATTSNSTTSLSPSNTLPTPPTADTDVFKPSGQGRDGTFNVAAAAVQHGMASNLEPSGAGGSLTARRLATSNLPSFELPPPPQLQKFHSFSSANSNAPATISVGNLLTPPTNVPGDNLSPISSGVSNVSPAASQGLPPYTPTSYWPSQTSATTPFSFGSGTPALSWNQGPPNPLFPSRGLFSPSLGSLVRNSSNSPTATEGLPPPPYDLNHLPPFPSSVSMATSGNLPTIAHQQALGHPYLVQHPASASTSQPSPVNNAPDSYLQRPPPTPGYYNGSQPSSTPQQNHFPNFSNASPVQQSPMGGSGGSRPPNNGQPPNLQPTPLQQQQGSHFGRPYAYSLPAMNGSMQGPIMSNIHSPGGQMSMVGAMPNQLGGGMMPSFNSGHSAQLQMYSGQQQSPLNERPFKCDQCPQSFNRNHDLKRHKRIHLAVKPFPCGHCEKSFSRKDALKVGFLTHFICKPFKLKIFAAAYPREGLREGSTCRLHYEGPRFNVAGGPDRSNEQRQ